MPDSVQYSSPIVYHQVINQLIRLLNISIQSICSSEEILGSTLRRPIEKAQLKSKQAHWKYEPYFHKSMQQRSVIYGTTTRENAKALRVLVSGVLRSTVMIDNWEKNLLKGHWYLLQ